MCASKPAKQRLDHENTAAFTMKIALAALPLASLAFCKPVNSFQERATDIQLTILNQPGRERLTQALVQGRPPGIKFIGTWKLGLWIGSRALEAEQSGTYDRIISVEEWRRLLQNGSSISADDLDYE